MEKWEDPSIFSENQLPPHAPFREETVSLNGRWRFLCRRASEPLPDGFFETAFSARDWDRIDVPASWESRGYGKAAYFDTSLPPALSGKAKRIPQIDPAQNYTGIYRRSFKIPAGWKGKQIVLRFAGAGACIQVWVNGAYVGLSKSSRLPAEFDITAFLSGEKNTLCVQVHQYSDASYLESKGQWLLSGLYGDVELYALPAKGITDLQVEAVYHPSCTDVDLRVRLTTQNADGLTARIAVMDGNQVMFYGEGIVEQDEAQALIPCRGVRPWTAETPDQYRIAVILWDGVGIYHTREIPYGFRTVSIENRRLTLNGSPIQLQGVNYRPDPDSRTEARLRQDLQTMKRHNLNAVRVSTGLPDRFFDLCDEYGLYVLEEGLRPSDPRWEALATEQNRAIVCRHSLHPCVILWGNGISQELDDSLPGAMDYFSVEDPTLERLKQLSQGEDIPNASVGRSRLRAAVPSIPSSDYAHLPLLATAYGALQGNDTFPYREFRDHFLGNPQWMGGFLSDFMDPQLPWASEVPKASGLVCYDGLPHQVLSAVQRAFQPLRCRRLEDGSIEIENLSAFLPTSAYRCTYTLTRDGETLESGEIPTDIAPGAAETIPIPDKDSLFRPGRYHLTLRFALCADTPWAPAGTVLAWDQWEIQNHRHIRDENPGGSIREEGGSVILRAGDASYTISRSTGNLEQIQWNGKSLLTSPLSPVFCRAKTQSEPVSKQTEEWAKLTMKKKLPKPSVFEVDHMARTVTVTQNVGSGLMRSYRLFADGSLNVELRLRTGKTAPNRIGMSCVLGPDMDQFQWFGQGPWDTYPDRDCGWFGIHSQNVLEQDEYPIAQEHGCKQAFRLRLTNSGGLGLQVLADEGIFTSVWPYTLEDLVSGKRPEASGGTTLNLDCCQNGLRSQVLKPHTTYIYSFTIRPMEES